MMRAEKAMVTLSIGLILAVPSLGISIWMITAGIAPLWAGLAIGIGLTIAGFVLVYHVLFGIGRAEAMV